jgi:hypothetical protein
MKAGRKEEKLGTYSGFHCVMKLSPKISILCTLDYSTHQPVLG